MQESAYVRHVWFERTGVKFCVVEGLTSRRKVNRSCFLLGAVPNITPNSLCALVPDDCTQLAKLLYRVVPVNQNSLCAINEHSQYLSFRETFKSFSQKHSGLADRINYTPSAATNQEDGTSYQPSYGVEIGSPGRL